MTTLTTTVKQPMGLSRESRPGPRMPAGGGAQAALSASDIFRVLLQRIYLILLVWFMGSAAAVGLTIMTSRYFPLWSAEGLIRVESPTPTNPFDPWGARVDRDTVDRNLADQSRLLMDPALLRDVLARPEIRTGTDWFRQFNDNVEEALFDLTDNLISSPVRGTTLIRVSMPTRNPKDSPKIVNEVIRAYMEKVTGLSRSHYQDEAKVFEAEVTRKDRELDGINENLAELEREGDIPAMFSGAPTVTVRLERLQSELVTKESELEILRARYEAYKNMTTEELQSSAELMARVEADPRISSQVRHITDLTERRETLSLRFGEKHMTIREIDKQLLIAQEEVESLRRTSMVEERNGLMESYRIAFYSALQAVAELRESAQESTQLQLDLDVKLQRYRILLDERAKVDRERERYAEAHAQLLMVARTEEPVRIQILRRATVPLEPSRPRPKLWIPVGVIVSLALAVGLALALSLLDTSLRTPRDIIRHAGLPLLGTVPVLDDEEATIEDIEAAARLAPNSLVAESFRQIRANLLFSSPLEQQQSLLIASASPDEGKTCVAINLAVTLAQGGRRILLVDANFRRPGLHKAFGVTNHQGLSNLLVGRESLEGLVVHSELGNLDVLPSGPCPPNPAELLAGGYLPDLLAEAAERYDQIIFDGPPLLLVSDAAMLAALVDGVVMVCRARTSRGMVLRAKSQLGLVNARIVGAVLNAAETTRGGYFRKYYREFYDYQEPEEPVEPKSEGVEALPPARAERPDASSLSEEPPAQDEPDDFPLPDTASADLQGSDDIDLSVFDEDTESSPPSEQQGPSGHDDAGPDDDDDGSRPS